MKKRGSMNRHRREKNKRPNPARETPNLEAIEQAVMESATRVMLLELARQIGYSEAYTVLTAWQEIRKFKTAATGLAPEPAPDLPS